MRPTSPFVAGFMGADNALDVIAHRRTARRGGERRSRRPTAARAFPQRCGAPRALASRGRRGLVVDGVIAQTVYVGHG